MQSCMSCVVRCNANQVNALFRGSTKARLSRTTEYGRQRWARALDEKCVPLCIHSRLQEHCFQTSVPAEPANVFDAGIVILIHNFGLSHSVKADLNCRAGEARRRIIIFSTHVDSSSYAAFQRVHLFITTITRSTRTENHPLSHMFDNERCIM